MTETVTLKGGPESVAGRTFTVEDNVQSISVPYAGEWDDGPSQGWAILQYRRTPDGFEYHSTEPLHPTIEELDELDIAKPKRSPFWLKLWPFTIAYKRGYDDRMDDYWEEGGW